MKKIVPLEHGLIGLLKVPGDKSISHRAVMLSSLGDSTVEVKNFLYGADCLSTIGCMRSMGVEIVDAGNRLLITGRGLDGLIEPTNVLDAGNSGTTLRLLLGLLSTQNFLTTFTGDDSLRQRPMARVIKPLTSMGATIVGRNFNKNLPITILPSTSKLHGIKYEMPVASAQVKSAILLAGLRADSPTTVIEPHRSRDHTERMLEGFGARLERRGNAVTIYPIDRLQAPTSIEVPGDISSAAYWIVLASIVEGSDAVIEGVGVNETRTGIIDVLRAMGATIEFLNERSSGGELIADIRVMSTRLKGVEFGGETIPRLIDEIPIIAVAAAFAEGDTIINDVGELRVKESDRLAAIVEEFNRLSAGSFEAQGDSLIIHGRRQLSSARCSTRDDHRMAMSLSIFGAAGAGVELDRPDCVDISYPTFYQTLEEA